ncbi:MAG: LysR family transcriptional regulator [Chitinivibrionales bacterium]|nr:LysR family transcriptional regulator [Chitinivibrionales bacterium]
MIKPNCKLYISTEQDKGAFGDGKYLLLKAVKQHRSIQLAAQSLGRAYRKAWGDIKRAEQGLGRRLVTTSRGGSTGGESALTEFGDALLTAWEHYQSEVRNDVNALFSKHLRSTFQDERQ